MARLSTPATAGLLLVGLAVVVGANAEWPTPPVVGMPEPFIPVTERLPGESLRIPAPGDGASRDQGSRQLQAARPFEHSRHERLSCRECHGSGERHRTVTVQTPRECAACHHDPRRGYACGACHRAAELPAGPLARPMVLTVWEGSRARTLPFAHETHAGLACQDCHGTQITRAANRECTDCHAEHHRPEANCASCHLSPERSVHPAESHLSCAGSGCHAPAAAPSPALSRSLCIFCHADQRNHEPGGDCTACHQIPDTPVRRTESALPAAPAGGGGP